MNRKMKLFSPVIGTVVGKTANARLADVQHGLSKLGSFTSLEFLVDVEKHPKEYPSFAAYLQGYTIPEMVEKFKVGRVSEAIRRIKSKLANDPVVGRAHRIFVPVRSPIDNKGRYGYASLLLCNKETREDILATYATQGNMAVQRAKDLEAFVKLVCPQFKKVKKGKKAK